MKNFLRFIVMIIVVAILFFLVKFLMDQNKIYVLTHIDEYSNNTLTTPVPTPNNIEDEQPKTLEEQLKEIKDIERENSNSQVKMTSDDKLSSEFLGAEYNDYFQTFNVDTTSVRVQVADRMVHFMPQSDFIDEQEFHYNDEGELVLYKNTGSGSGFITKLYFDKGELVYREDEDAGEIMQEGDNISGEGYTPREYDVNELLSRSALIYEKYLSSFAQ